MGASVRVGIVGEWWAVGGGWWVAGGRWWVVGGGWRRVPLGGGAEGQWKGRKGQGL